MTTKAQDIAAVAAQLAGVLSASTLTHDDQREAMRQARAQLDKQAGTNEQLDDWRRKRMERGVVGSGKKADAMRSERDALKKTRPAKSKR